MACFATPYGLRYAAHCFNRDHEQQNGSALIPAGGKLGVTSAAIIPEGPEPSVGPLVAGVAASAPTEPPRAGTIAIELANGARLTVDSFVNEKALARVLRALKAVPC